MSQIHSGLNGPCPNPHPHSHQPPTGISTRDTQKSKTKSDPSPTGISLSEPQNTEPRSEPNIYTSGEIVFVFFGIDLPPVPF